MKKILLILMLTLLAVAMFYSCAANQGSQRPSWVDNPPDPSGDYVYFVGQSAPYLSESAARENAEQEGIVRVSQWVQQEVLSFAQRIKADMGMESKGVDVARVSREYEQFFTKQRFSSGKTKSYYTETKTLDTGENYIVFSLYQVSRSELNGLFDQASENIKAQYEEEKKKGMVEAAVTIEVVNEMFNKAEGDFIGKIEEAKK